jgi:ankyrin repeat protein
VSWSKIGGERRRAPAHQEPRREDESLYMSSFMRETPLHTAVALKKDDVIQYLVRKRAKVNIENCKGQTIMQCADENTRRHIMHEIQSRSVLHASRFSSLFQFSKPLSTDVGRPHRTSIRPSARVPCSQPRIRHSRLGCQPRDNSPRSPQTCKVRA